MPQLNASFIENLLSAFDETIFTKDDFSFDFPDKGNNLVIVRFLHKPEYFFICTEAERQEKVTIDRKYVLETQNETRRYKYLQVAMSPGEYKAKDEKEIYDLGEILRIVPNWAKYIRNDLYTAAPKIDPLKDLREKFKAGIESSVDDPDGFFSEEEIQDISGKFDNMMNQLNKLKDELSITNQQLDEIKKEIEQFKRNAKNLPKGLWAKATSNKLMQSIGKFINTPEGRTFLFDQAKKLIGSGE